MGDAAGAGADGDKASRECANCKKKGDRKTLKRCAGCTRVSYCGVECQRTHWKKGGHKQVCKSSGKPATPGDKAGKPEPSKTKPSSNHGDLMAIPKGLEHARFVFVGVGDPKTRAVGATCGICGVVLKKTGSEITDMNAGKELDGVFPLPLPKRYDPAIPGSRQLPGEIVISHKGNLSTKIVMWGDMNFGAAELGTTAVSACLFCTRKIMCGSPAQGLAWMKRCERWIDNVMLPNEDASKVSDLSLFEQRMVALTRLVLTPDLSKGRRSIIGHRCAPFGARIKGEGKPETFEDPVEATAFPALFPTGKGIWDGPDMTLAEASTEVEQLRRYTMIRLHSACDRWRTSQDYVAFALQRMAAYGDQSMKAALDSLPPPVDVNDPSTLRDPMFMYLQNW